MAHRLLANPFAKIPPGIQCEKPHVISMHGHLLCCHRRRYLFDFTAAGWGEIKQIAWNLISINKTRCGADNSAVPCHIIKNFIHKSHANMEAASRHGYSAKFSPHIKDERDGADARAAIFYGLQQTRS